MFFPAVWPKQEVLAASYSLDQVSKSVNINESFSLKLKIDTQGEAVTSGDAVFQFNPAILEFVSASNGTFFSDFHSPSPTAGEARIGGSVGLGGSPKTSASGGELFASLTFRAKAAGTSSLTFKCNGDIDSGVFKPDPATSGAVVNVLNCSSLTNGSYTVLAGTPSPTGTGTASPGRATCDFCGYCEGGTKPGSWEKCRDCLYPGLTDTLTGNPTPVPGKSWTVLGCLSTTPGGFVQTFLKFFITIAGGLAFLALLWGGVTILTSSGDPQKLNSGREIIISSIVGLLLIVFSVFILKLIGFEIFKIPGFGP